MTHELFHLFVLFERIFLVLGNILFFCYVITKIDAAKDEGWVWWTVFAAHLSYVVALVLWAVAGGHLFNV